MGTELIWMGFESLYLATQWPLNLHFSSFKGKNYPNPPQVWLGVPQIRRFGMVPLSLHEGLAFITRVKVVPWDLTFHGLRNLKSSLIWLAQHVILGMWIEVVAAILGTRKLIRNLIDWFLLSSDANDSDWNWRTWTLGVGPWALVQTLLLWRIRIKFKSKWSIWSQLNKGEATRPISGIYLLYINIRVQNGRISACGALDIQLSQCTLKKKK